MTRTVSAADANRNFSKLLREVEQGEEFVVTSHGRPVARLGPAVDQDAKEEKEAKWQALFQRLASQPILNLPRITRDELYER